MNFFYISGSELTFDSVGYNIVSNSDLETFWLKPRVEKISDYHVKIESYVEKLLYIGKAYVCTCTKQRINYLQSKKKTCDCRYRHNRENLLLWDNIDSKKFKNTSIFVRLSLDLHHKEKVLRDPIIFDKQPTTDFSLAVMGGILNEQIINSGNVKLQDYLQRLLFIGSKGNLMYKKHVDKPISELLNKGILREALVVAFNNAKTLAQIKTINKNMLESMSKTFSFISNPKRVRIQDCERELFFISSKDFKELKNGYVYHLKDFLNFIKKNSYLVCAKSKPLAKRKRKSKELLWLDYKNHPKTVINNQKGVIDKRILKEKINSIVFLPGYGYYRLKSKTHLKLDLIKK